MDKDKSSRDLLTFIQTNATSRIESFIRTTRNKEIIKSIVLNEMTLSPLLETVFTGNVLIFKLLQCEIHSLTPAHYAALMGQTDILVTLFDYVTPDSALESGSTLLHMASFGGNMGTVKLLLDVYRAQPAKRDKYGWTALHYASTEGHVGVVKVLIEHGVDIHVRDKDGTCAALRAKWHGHELLVDHFCKIGDEDFLLNIDLDDGEDVQDNPLYATVSKSKQMDPKITNGQKKNPIMSDPPAISVDRRASNAERPKQKPAQPRKTSLDKFSTLPARFKQKDNESVRRIIRENLESAFSDYEVPVGLAGNKLLADQQDMQAAGVGMNTMTKIMREEIQKYKDFVLTPQKSLAQQASAASIHEEPLYQDEEDPYMTLGNAPPLPSPSGSVSSLTGPVANHPAAPPPPPALPPRNPGMQLTRTDLGPNSSDDDAFDYVRVDPKARIDPVTRQMGLAKVHTSAALDAATEKLGDILGNDWKRLARALPMDTDPRKLEARIKNIEKQYLGNAHKQAEAALIEWRINAGSKADIDSIILALRSCGFHDKIEAVERVTQEFTA